MPHQAVPPRNRALARQMRRAMPDAEFRLWCELRRRRPDGLRFRRQQPIGRFIVDFYCAEKRLVVEVDGEQHASANRLAADLERTRALEAAGCIVIRFWTHDVEQDLDSVCQAILTARAVNAKRLTALLQPPPCGEVETSRQARPGGGSAERRTCGQPANAKTPELP